MKKNQISDIFDWCKSFDFNNLIKGLEDNGNILKQSDILVDNNHAIFFNKIKENENASKTSDLA